MPFTFSHPAIVLPFNLLHKKWLSLTALIIGSMTPDFEYFIKMKVSSQYSHTWLGLLWFDMPLGLLLMLLFNSVVKNKLIDHLPIYLNKRFSGLKNASNPIGKPKLITIIFSLFIGIASHIFWDDFTHPTGYFVENIQILRHLVFTYRINHIRVYNIIQHLSSLIGALVIVYTIIKLPDGELTRYDTITYYWIKIALAALLVLTMRILGGLSFRQYGDDIVTGISGMFIGLILASITTAPKKVAL